LSPVVDGIIIGFGLNSYELAIQSILSQRWITSS
jgi:3-dehydroquinate dehydratase